MHRYVCSFTKNPVYISFLECFFQLPTRLTTTLYHTYILSYRKKIKQYYFYYLCRFFVFLYLEPLSTHLHIYFMVPLYLELPILPQPLEPVKEEAMETVDYEVDFEVR